MKKTIKKEPEVVCCFHCDFGSGMRGMDSCGKCEGTGSLFRVKGGFWSEYFPNTKAGYKEAKKELRKYK